jgi:hypothetical protein
VDRSKWLDDVDVDDAVIRRRRPNPARRFAVVYFMLSLVAVAASLGFLGGFLYGAHQQKTAPVVRGR